ncbi:MAG: hypothetical protein F4Y94_05785 [Chloroflexi bacterium]|nr:hypothetical protein [Chloroflexota bacterium]
MASSPATSYVRTMFATTDHVAILAVPRRSQTGVVQEVMRAGTLAQPDAQSRLQELNRQGYDVYCTVNSVKPNAQSRTKTDIADVRRLQLDLDDNGRQGLAKLRADVDAGRVPSPAVVMQSSKGRFQVLWHTVPGAWTPAAAEATMMRLANAYGGDRVVTDVARVMRLPGFANHKEGRDGWVVTWARYDGPRTMQADFRALPQPDKASITQIIEHRSRRRNREAFQRQRQIGRRAVRRRPQEFTHRTQTGGRTSAVGVRVDVLRACRSACTPCV